MRNSHIYALSAALTLTAALVLVVGGDPSPEPEIDRRLVVAAVEDTTTTSLDIVISPEDDKALVLSATEVALTEVAAQPTTTTSSTTTTTIAPKKKTSSGTKTKTTSPPTTAPSSPPATITPEFRSDYESEFRGSINSLRASQGLAALTSNGALNGRARDWAKRMADSGELKHSNIASLVPPWAAAGENVGRGGSVSSIFGNLRASGGHLSNMVGDYTDIGVGVWKDETGTLWTVHVFAR